MKNWLPDFSKKGKKEAMASGVVRILQHSRDKPKASPRKELRSQENWPSRAQRPILGDSRHLKKFQVV